MLQLPSVMLCFLVNESYARANSIASADRLVLRPLHETKPQYDFTFQKHRKNIEALQISSDVVRIISESRKPQIELVEPRHPHPQSSPENAAKMFITEGESCAASGYVLSFCFLNSSMRKEASFATIVSTSRYSANSTYHQFFKRKLGNLGRSRGMYVLHAATHIPETRNFS